MRKIIYFLAISLAFPIIACTNSEKPVSTSTDSVSIMETGVVYSCPMHPEVKSDKPGTCHICKMELVKESGTAEGQAIDTMSNDHKH